MLPCPESRRLPDRGAVPIEIAPVRSHSGWWLSFAAHGQSTCKSLVSEPHLPIVDQQVGISGIVSYVEVGQAIRIDVGESDHEADSVSITHCIFEGDGVKAGPCFIAIDHTEFGFIDFWRTACLQPFSVIAVLLRILIEMDVIEHDKIQPLIAIQIH